MPGGPARATRGTTSRPLTSSLPANAGGEGEVCRPTYARFQRAIAREAREIGSS